MKTTTTTTALPANSPRSLCWGCVNYNWAIELQDRKPSNWVHECYKDENPGDEVFDCKSYEKRN